MTVVSNTSPLSNLAAIAHIELLLEIYGTITIPTAVADELSRAGPDALGVREVPNLAWIEIRPVTNRPLVEHLRGDRLLHLGEAEAIAPRSRAGCRATSHRRAAGSARGNSFGSSNSRGFGNLSCCKSS